MKTIGKALLVDPAGRCVRGFRSCDLMIRWTERNYFRVTAICTALRSNLIRQQVRGARNLIETFCTFHHFRFLRKDIRTLITTAAMMQIR